MTTDDVGKAFDRIVKKRNESKVLNDYFEGAVLYRVFGWQHDVEMWREVFASSPDEAKKIAEETIVDFEFDQAIPEPKDDSK